MRFISAAATAGFRGQDRQVYLLRSPCAHCRTAISAVIAITLNLIGGKGGTSNPRPRHYECRSRKFSRTRLGRQKFGRRGELCFRSSTSAQRHSGSTSASSARNETEKIPSESEPLALNA